MISTEIANLTKETEKTRKKWQRSGHESERTMTFFIAFTLGSFNIYFFCSYLHEPEYYVVFYKISIYIYPITAQSTI